MARRRNPDSLSHIFLRLTLAAGFSIFIWFVAAQVITHMFTTMQEDMLARNSAAQAQALAKMREAQAQQAVRQHPPQQRQTMSASEALQPSTPKPSRSDALRLKDAAWEQFYQAPRGCDVWRSDQHMVQCQNDMMKAKREFEHRWATGEFAQPSS
jgi:hypothetical protein